MAEPTGSIIRMPKVENALGQSTTSAASQKVVTDGINQAKSAASTADGKAVTAQNTATAAQTAANGAKTAADNAQKTANEAKTAASTAQTAANNANSNANGRVPSGRKVNNKALTADISLTAADVGALTKAQADGYYQPKGSSSGVTFGAVEQITGSSSDQNPTAWMFNVTKNAAGQEVTSVRFPDNVVVTNFGIHAPQPGKGAWYKMTFRRITGGV